MEWQPKRNPSLHGSVLSHAREMRKNPTEAERKLWDALRFDRLDTRFRRQHPIENMIIDFYCHDAKLGIEVDGPIHDARLDFDEDREIRLWEDHGIQIIRFPNEEVLHDLPRVIAKIKELIQSPPPPGEGPGVGEMNEKMGEGKEMENEIKKGGLGGEVELLKILDLGTGGGFPLLPLAICLPQYTFTGMDSVQKKIAAVQRIIDAMKIPNASLVCGRSEELAREGAHREQYDVVLVRGLAALNVLLELAAPFVKVGGHILCWKSLNIDRELNDSLLARAELSCQMEKPHEYNLGGTWGRRQILVFRKRAKTSDKFPREVGEPKKNPLL
ncbi:MAG: DUF559 domain-containing protein [Candidatus Peribacteraceae bacterium]|nr:DUF559 domain-containing protein [Candidatus Peribacteraceae bacterium]MDD5742153.1 DUF559 domain-containing protein [Candidatus Peribacteraceae bacterium]